MGSIREFMKHFCKHCEELRKCTMNDFKKIHKCIEKHEKKMEEN